MAKQSKEYHYFCYDCQDWYPPETLCARVDSSFVSSKNYLPFSIQLYSCLPEKHQLELEIELESCFHVVCRYQSRRLRALEYSQKRTSRKELYLARIRASILICRQPRRKESRKPKPARERLKKGIEIGSKIQKVIRFLNLSIAS